MHLTQTQIKKIIKEEIQNVLGQEAEQSDGGTTITAQELEKIPAAIDFKGALEQVKKQYIDTVNKNKDKLEKLSQQNADKALNEGLGMFYLALQIPALAISLAQLAAKGAAYVAKKMGRPPTDPSNEYYNDFHKTFDTYADFIKRQFQSVGLHAAVLGVAKFIYRNDQAKYEKVKENINLVMDALMVIMGIVIAYGGIDAIAKASAETEKMLNIAGNNKIAADILGKIDEFAGYKDLFKAVLKKITI